MIAHQTYIYKQVGTCSIHADVYPAPGPKAPAVLFLHGGALIWGSRTRMIPEQIALYNQAGYTVISLDYRLAPETNLEGIISDVRDAIHWARTASNQLGIDPDRIALVGSSAGAYLALNAGTFAEKPRAIVAFYGYGDILADWYLEPSDYYLVKERVTREEAHSVLHSAPIAEGDRERFLFYLYCRQQGIWPDEITGYDPAFERAKILPFCPAYNVGPDYPPTLLLHGDQDTDVPYEQSVQMANEFAKTGIDHQLITVHGAGHVFDYDMSRADVQEIFKTVLEFLGRIV